MTYQLYWGDLHSHCSISYGHGTAEQALMRARQQLDFCSITGHAFWPDMPTDRGRYSEVIDYHLAGFATLARNWSKLLSLQAEHTVAGEFIAFPSFEWHSMQYGDHNVYGKQADLPLADAGDLPALRETVKGIGGMAIPHHIGYPAGFRGINWNEYRPDCSPFVEIYSLHGCSLDTTSPFPMLHDMGPRDSASTAEAGWQMGHRFGIAGGTDHHAAYPGSHGDGRMGVFATQLTRDALWEAFFRRRVFAATGDRIDARMFLNGAWIGDCVKANKSRRIRTVVHAGDTVDKVEVVKNGRVIRRFFAQPATVDAALHTYRLRLSWGWGDKSAATAWLGSLRLSDGMIRKVETCFSGQPIVAPRDATAGGGLDAADLPHALVEQSSRGCAWRSVTQGNPTMRHATTQALSLEVEAPLSAVLHFDVNQQVFDIPLGDLLRKSQSRFMRGWLSEAFCAGPLVPIDECTVTAEFDDGPELEVDVYRLQVAQRNGQWAWLTPIWVEQC